jgi:hypothetical protein
MADQYDIDELVTQLKEFVQVARRMGTTGASGQDSARKFDRGTERIVQALARLGSQIKKDTVTRAKADRELQDFVKAVDRATDAVKDEIDASIEKAKADQEAADSAASLAQAQQDAARTARMSAEERAAYEKRKAEELQAERWKALQAELRDQYEKIGYERNYGQMLAKERIKQIDQYSSLESRLGRFGDMIIKSRLGPSLAKNAQTAMAVQMAMLRVQSAAESASKTMVGLGKGLLSIGDSTKGFTQFNGVIDGVVQSLGKMLESIPILGTVLSGSLQLAAEGSKFVLDRLQKAAEAFRDVSSVGALTAGGMTELQRQFIESGVSLDDYKRAVAENSSALARFGGTVGEGAKRFSKFVGDITRSDLGDQLRRLGFSASDISDTAGAFVTQQTRLGLSQRKTNAQLTQGAMQYAKELDQLSKLTGMQRKEIQSQQDAALGEARFRAQYDEMVAQGREKEAKAMLDFQTMVSKAAPEMGQGFRDVAAGFVNTEAAQKLFVDTGGASVDIMNRLKAGHIDQIQAFKELQEATSRNMQTSRDLAKATGDSAGVMTNYAQKSDLVNARIIDGQVRLANEQEAQMRKGTDPLTDSTVDAQKSMDQLARQMDTFAFAAMPAAAEAVNQFTGALNDFIRHVAKETGMDIPTLSDASVLQKSGTLGGITDEKTGALTGKVGAAAGATTLGTAGAAIGSIIPGVGTAIGAGIGAALGGAAGYFGLIDYGLVDNKKQRNNKQESGTGDSEKKQTDARKQATQQAIEQAQKEASWWDRLWSNKQQQTGLAAQAVDQAAKQLESQKAITRGTRVTEEATWSNATFAENDREGFQQYQSRINELRREMLRTEQGRLEKMRPNQAQFERMRIQQAAEEQARNEFYERANRAGAAQRKIQIQHEQQQARTAKDASDLAQTRVDQDLSWWQKLTGERSNQADALAAIRQQEIDEIKKSLDYVFDDAEFAQKDNENYRKYVERRTELFEQKLKILRQSKGLFARVTEQEKQQALASATIQAQQNFAKPAQAAGAMQRSAPATGNVGTRSATAPAVPAPKGGQAQIPRASGGGAPSVGSSVQDLFRFGSGTGSENHFEKLNPAVQQAMINMGAEYQQLTGRVLSINSAYRSVEEQARINSGGRPRAAPGMSKHQQGMAVDINSNEASFLAQSGLLNKYGFKWGASFGDPPHIYMRDGGVIPARPGGVQVTAAEAGQNEAFVPLPDGRRIPVDIKGLDNDALIKKISRLDGTLKLLTRSEIVETSRNDSQSFRAEVQRMAEILSQSTQEAVNRGLDVAAATQAKPLQTLEQLSQNFMAKGGITQGPSIAGEAGPEAVIPLQGKSIPMRFVNDPFGELKRILGQGFATFGQRTDKAEPPTAKPGFFDRIWDTLFGDSKKAIDQLRLAEKQAATERVEYTVNGRKATREQYEAQQRGIAELSKGMGLGFDRLGTGMGQFNQKSQEAISGMGLFGDSIGGFDKFVPQAMAEIQNRITTVNASLDTDTTTPNKPEIPETEPSSLLGPAGNLRNTSPIPVEMQNMSDLVRQLENLVGLQRDNNRTVEKLLQAQAN